MTKKSHQKFWQMKIEEFCWETVKLDKFFMEPENFSEIGGKSETGEKCFIASGG